MVATAAGGVAGMARVAGVAGSVIGPIGPAATRNRTRARDRRDFTDPFGQPSTSAVSASDRSRK